MDIIIDQVSSNHAFLFQKIIVPIEAFQNNPALYTKQNFMPDENVQANRLKIYFNFGI